ncbi:fimbrial protein [Shewanella fidelis]|uniref:Fimbrial protein n=1 Tax=Shewanella fidelis TaxID=173509 RepID=A0AAW8NHU7_9GAMM|nr:hypothetical protein [Shewanella fidelis]MDR8522457.1 hypothetical protein [Shewanella fidelis]MDW4813009.1 hypothetical protein [Shewanella fidelis]MDW4816732.1 hypothetical protein [Shewanella fidelis]MDW4821016.1 hypothetical protein [Shewanella fidelis]MDW4825449.1 hypothetical protein [Shewanella fidelis]
MNLITTKKYYLFWFILFLCEIFTITYVNASVPSNPGAIAHRRCANPNADTANEYRFFVNFTDTTINTSTPIGEVLTTIEMQGGAWDFQCNYTSKGGYLRVGGYKWASATSLGSTICQIPGMPGFGIRFYVGGTARNCNDNIGHKPLITINNGTITSASVSEPTFAELIHIAPGIDSGTYSFGGKTMDLTTRAEGNNSVSTTSGVLKMKFANQTIEARSCAMVTFNQTIDFGHGISKGDEVISKPFDITLTGCSGAALDDFKTKAKLSFTSPRINAIGTQLANCEDSDCANGAYITFTDKEGDDVNLKAGYMLNDQTNTPTNKLNFNANLHTESTTSGKIDTSITILLEYI